jgi:nitrilase
VQRAARPADLRPYTAACVQAAPTAFDIRRTLVKARDLAADAARQGARLAVFPEAFVSAYPRGHAVRGRGRCTVAGRARGIPSLPPLIYRHPGPCGRCARRDHALYLVIGVIERDGGTLYCATLTFADHGVPIGRRRKLMPAGSERLVWGFGDGSTLGVAETPLGRIGTVICRENYMPMLGAAMYA